MGINPLFKKKLHRSERPPLPDGTVSQRAQHASCAARYLDSIFIM